ncbi:glycosyltransferase family 2 protein [Streptomyces tritici]|uniref:glycosyltransferase family 2 protein n=1 Tax=Streptomyces tritici TaxID=2054410 RepID=UPI003AF0A8B9
MTEHPSPDVTVIIGAYEAMPYLVKCLESVENQTIGADRVEIVAVDDGSTDGTGEYLDAFAARSKVPTRVIHQPNSGGPGGPRNTGLAQARGRYVFFLDADDHFGEEALERLVAMGDRAGTDVILGRIEGVNRNAAKSMWGATVERADVYTSNVKFTLSAQKLFRRDLLMRYGIRFDTSMRTGEDALFTMEAYLRGNGVSVVADYTCYYLVGRDDGKHLTKSGDYDIRFLSARRLMELIAAHERPGEKRDLLMIRPFVTTLLPQFGHVLLRQDDATLAHKLELAAPLMRAYWTKGVAGRLKPQERLRLACVALGKAEELKAVVEYERTKRKPETVSRRGRRYLALPYFGDRSAGIPDWVYEIAGPTPSQRLWRAARRRAGALLRRRKG